MKYQDYFLFAGGLISLLNLCAFAWRIWSKRDQPQSPASWMMWLVIDSLLLITTWANSKPIWLPLSYVIGAGTTMTANFVRGAWSWTWRETLCAVCAAVSTWFWLRNGDLIGLVASVAAMTIAGVPLLIDLLRRPVRKTFPVWAWTVVACACTILGSDGTLAGTILAWSGIAFNGTLCVIVLKDKGPAKPVGTN